MKRICVTLLVAAMAFCAVLAPLGSAARAAGVKYDGLTKSEAEKYKLSDFIDASGKAAGNKDQNAAKQGQALRSSGLTAAGSYTELLSALSKMKVFYDEKATNTSRNTAGDVMDMDYDDDVAVADEAEAPKSSAAPAAAESAAGDGGHSTTNVQVEGVDEADIIKTNGKNIFYLNDTKVSIFSRGPKSALAATIKPAADTYFEDMYLSGNKLVIVARYSDNSYYRLHPNSYWSVKPYTVFLVYDITHPLVPRLTRTVRLEGYCVSTRLLNNRVYFVTQRYLSAIPYREGRLADVMPAYYDSAAGSDARFVDIGDIYYNPQCTNPNLMLLGEFNLAGDDSVNSTAVFDTAGQIYMNSSSLYVTSHHWSTDSTKTVIHRYRIVDGSLSYVATGSVSGYLLNQYSMDEHNGTFRIATTDSKADINRLYTLNANTLTVQGMVLMAKGERIYAVRFTGDTGYVVTYRQVDPLFVIDLKDPKAPKILGQLKVPGFSNYLHPFMNNYLIGIGRETTPLFIQDSSGNYVDTGDTRDIGLKLSLFDVSDPTNPKELHKLILGNSGSTYTNADYNPKTIMVDKAKGIFAFPISSVDGEQSENRRYWSGGVVISANPTTGFKQLAMLKPSGNNYFSSYNSRFCYIGNVLYFVSSNTLMTYDYTTFEKLGELKF